MRGTLATDGDELTGHVAVWTLRHLLIIVRAHVATSTPAGPTTRGRCPRGVGGPAAGGAHGLAPAVVAAVAPPPGLGLKPPVERPGLRELVGRAPHAGAETGEERGT